MALGLIGAALSGGAEAAQDNARTRIKQMHDEAILRMRQNFAKSERIAGQEFTTNERVAGQGFTSEQNELNRGHDLTLTQMREQGANSRTGAQIAAGDRRAQMGLLQQGMSAEGNPVWFNPVSGERYDAPEGVTLSSPDLTGRQKAQLDMLENQAKPLREKMAEGMPLTPEEKTTLGQLEAQAQSLIGGGQQGMTPFQQLMQGEGGSQPEAKATNPDTIPGQVRQQQEERRNTQEANEARRQASQARDSADAVLQRIEREAAGGATRGGLLAQVNQAAGRGEVSQEAIAEAQQVVQQILALDQNPSISVDEKRWLSERLIRLQEAGVPLNLDQ
tara:strand:- start:5793 stop:6791 length:999 start_codon:yes stop_codon:yes gene_type:complete